MRLNTNEWREVMIWGYNENGEQVVLRGYTDGDEVWFEDQQLTGDFIKDPLYRLTGALGYNGPALLVDDGPLFVERLCFKE